MSSKTFCILGGTGFVGSHLCARLVADGHRVKVLSRYPYRARHLLVLPTLELVAANVHDEAVLAREFAGVDVVVNLVGILNERGRNGRGFQLVHSELARKVVDACRKTGVTRLLHMSAINADAARGPSHYLRTKGEAESIVFTQCGPRLGVTAFQPSVIFGPGDSFLNRFANLLRRVPLVFPLACPEARFAPVYVGDVVEAFVRALDERETYGQRYALCGPRVYTLRELVAYTAHLIGVRRLIIGLPAPLSALQAYAFDYLFGLFTDAKPFSIDNYRSLSVPSVCTTDGLGALGITPTALEAIAPRYLGKGGTRAHYDAYRQAYGRRY